jgi:hypothetical protein
MKNLLEILGKEGLSLHIAKLAKKIFGLPLIIVQNVLTKWR